MAEETKMAKMILALDPFQNIAWQKPIKIIKKLIVAELFFARPKMAV